MADGTVASGGSQGGSQRATRASYDAVAGAYAEQVEPLAADDVEMAGVFDTFVAHVGASCGRVPRVADVGCGPGWWAHRMAEAGASVVGVDLSPAMVALGPSGVGRLGQAGAAAGAGLRDGMPGASFVVGDAVAVPLADGSLDGVALWYMLHHLTDSGVVRALGEARRVLRPGGATLIGGHVGSGARIKREGYGHAMEVLVAKRSPQWWDDALRAARFAVAQHEVSDDGGHHVVTATAV